MSISPCCFPGFQWDGTPQGRVEKIDGIHEAYVTGDEKSQVGILVVHDAHGWTFNNTRLLADHFAREVGARVYVPDFFGGEVLEPREEVLKGNYSNVDMAGFISRNTREIREPEILAVAGLLRGRHDKLGAVGYCYGGWAVFRLAGKESGNLVDCIVCVHPGLLTEQDVDEVDAPVLMLCPEVDRHYPDEMKEYTFKTLQSRGHDFAYRHYRGVKHGDLVRGDLDGVEAAKAMRSGKNATVAWFLEQLCSDEGRGKAQVAE
jgi:dienelactone hydrolase